MINANYILLDASKMEGHIVKAKELNPNHTCLFEADTAKFLDTVAPWLFEFKIGSEFAKWISTEGRGKSWGILFNSEAEPIDLYKHLRRFLVVEGSDGKEMYFRYYSPQVLSAFLPTCSSSELKEFFGPIQSFIAEDNNKLLVEYSLLNQEYSRVELQTDMTDFGNLTPKVSKHSLDQIEKENKLFTQSEEDEAGGKAQKDISLRNTESDNKEDNNASSSAWDFGY